MNEVIIREGDRSDFGQIWPFFKNVVAAGDTYAYFPTTTRDEAEALWYAPPFRVYVAVMDGRVVGSYHVGANQLGLGDHVANAGFMVDPEFRGRGIAKEMCEHALATAKARGFKAMQFNFVVTTNERAVVLWEKQGFTTVGRVPEAFRHANGTLVDVLIMHKFL